MISKLNHVVSLESMTSVVSCVRFLLGVVSFIVLVVETVVVSRWGKLGVMELFVVITNSFHVLRGINSVWVIWRGSFSGISSDDVVVFS